MFESEQTKLDDFEAESIEEIRRETLLTLAHELGADETNAKDGIDSMLKMAEDLAGEFKKESVEGLNEVLSDNVDEELMDNKEEAEKRKKIEIIGACFLPPDGSKKGLEFAVGAQVLGILREEPGGNAFTALPKRIERWNMPPN